MNTKYEPYTDQCEVGVDGNWLHSIPRVGFPSLTEIELSKRIVEHNMSRSRGRGPKSKSQVRRMKAQGAPDVQPFMMFQVFDGYPWLEVRWREDAVPDKLDTDSLTRELVSTVQRHVAEAEKRAAHDVEADDKVRVSGVPYPVDKEKLNGADVLQEQGKQVYPY